MTFSNGGSFNDKVHFNWSVADLLRDDFKQSDYAKVILQLVAIRRLDCVLADTKGSSSSQRSALSGWSAPVEGR